MAIRTLVAGVMLATSAMAAPASTGTTGPAPGPTPPADNKSLFVDLFTSPTSLGRYQRLLVDPATGNLLTGDALRKVTVMDYNTSPPFDPGDKGGKFVAEVAATFPILVDLPISMVVAFLNPCSLLVPHTHPQVETIVVAQGSLQSGMLIENLVAPGHGTGEVVQNLTLFQGTVYPPGATHYQLNPSCEPTVFIASLASSDPGVAVNSHFINMANNASGPALGFPDKVTSAHELEEIRKNLPAGLIISLEQCMANCKGKY